MRFVTVAVAAVFVLTTPALAADDLMAGTYGNTVISKSSTIEGHWHYRADHSFDSSFSTPMGSLQSKGTWAIDDKGQLCRTFDAPPPGVTNPLCVAWTARKIGDAWQVTSNGRTSNLTLVAGVQ
ncbi:MAG TPA: hypothetical protein VGG10_11405 [Rhizomicrobium sp.]